MPLILNIETSSTICSVCLANNGALIDFREDKQGNSHARVLTVFIEELMRKNNIAFKELDAVAVSEGPGSYTGLRIGTSTAKGLCYALDKPLIAVPTLLAMADGVAKEMNDPSAVYMPALDARRMEIYTAVFDAQGNELIKTQAVIADSALAEKLNGFEKLFVFGNGAEKCKAVFKSDTIHFIADVNCDARFMIPVSESRANNNRFENLAYFEPLYLKEFGAKAGI